MKQTVRHVLDSAEFRRMVARRWQVSLGLTIALFVIYYGYIVLVAVEKPFMAQKIGQVTTLGIPLGVAVILLSWMLTGVYVVWANRAHDVDVRRLRDIVQRQDQKG